MVQSLTYGAVANGVPRVRAIGDPIMPLDDRYPKSVVFVLGWRTDADGATAQMPIGTAFFVSVPAAEQGRYWVYLVTAAHVIEYERETWVRGSMPNGSLITMPVPQWTMHPSADVAVAPVNAGEFGATYIAESSFLDVWAHRPTLGDRAYFIGLLHFATSMVESNVPMVRSGTLGRLYQERVPLQHGDGRVTYQQAHLIDCRSYGGFSGSPCFVQFYPKMVEGRSGPGVFIGGVSAIPETVCLGLISGHWDDMARAKGTGAMANDELLESIRFPINTGVGVVTPAESIRECFMDEELVAHRAEGDRQLREKGSQSEKETAATLDSIGGGPEMTKADFESALRRVSVRKASPKEP